MQPMMGKVVMPVAQAGYALGGFQPHLIENRPLRFPMCISFYGHAKIYMPYYISHFSPCK
jgi:hypothetical protein